MLGERVELEEIAAQLAVKNEEEDSCERAEGKSSRPFAKGFIAAIGQSSKAAQGQINDRPRPSLERQKANIGCRHATRIKR